MEIGEAVEWYDKIRRICAYPMYAGWSLLTIGIFLDNTQVGSMGGLLFLGAFFIMWRLLKGLSGGGDSGSKNKKNKQPPEIPAK